MGARKKYDVKYPNLYAVPGVHKHADEFNRVQRGHQSMMETMPNVIVMTLTAGLKFPKIAAGCCAAYCVGNYFYQSGYADITKDVKGARYTKPLAVLKPLGIVGTFALSVTTCVLLLTASAVVEPIEAAVAEPAFNAAPSPSE